MLKQNVGLLNVFYNSGGYRYGFYGTSTYYDDILEFVPHTGQWELVDRMIQAREFHAVSVINFESEVCFES